MERRETIVKTSGKQQQLCKQIIGNSISMERQQPCYQNPVTRTAFKRTGHTVNIEKKKEIKKKMLFTMEQQLVLTTLSNCNRRNVPKLNLQRKTNKQKKKRKEKKR